ncbi:MAG: catalase family protein, partial [Isosphaeraceae bacterium]
MNLAEEVRPEGEDDAISQVVRASEQVLEKDEKPVVKRDQHPKHHGCVRAEFIIEPDLPQDLRVGLFAEPKTYQSWIRLSNGSQRDDREADAHGMAIKLVGVAGPKVLEGHEQETTQDFVMIDNPVFFLRNAIDYGVFVDAMLKAKAKQPSALYSSLFFLPKKLRELSTPALSFFVPRRLAEFGKLLKFVSKRIDDPLTTRYWSTTPYLFGPGKAMKFSAKPAAEAGKPPADGSADYLREAMAARLKNADALYEYEFQVQLQNDAEKQPIEDPTVEWDEASCPFRTVARIRIPAQKFDTPERMSCCKNLSFTPWHALADHQPLGGINRTRKDVSLVLAIFMSTEASPVSQVIADELNAIDLRREHVFKLKNEEMEKNHGAASVPTPDAAADTPHIETPVPPNDEDWRLAQARLEALEKHVVGLSFSGGGIRSGTFAVGFLQGLAQV